MAVNTSPIGFEGFEKRLEITFSQAPISVDPHGLGLRALTRSQIDSITDAARCTIVSELTNADFDSYVLSESSLFIYPLKMIIKTCGTTKLLLAIPPIVELAKSLSLDVNSVKYTRGTFIFPDAQPAPHRNFGEEVAALNEHFGYLDSEAYILGDPAVPNRNWHVYSATKKAVVASSDEKAVVTLEMCMTKLNKQRASVFFKKSEDYTAKDMTRLSGINKILPSFEICDFDFDPCGYSMNAIDGCALSTIHVTPEDGFSYASYEAMGFDADSTHFESLIKRVLRCFGPSEFSVAITYDGKNCTWGENANVEGYTCEEHVKELLPGGGRIVYRCFSAVEEFGCGELNVGREDLGCVEEENAVSSPKSTLHCWEDVMEEVETGFAVCPYVAIA